MTESKPMRFAVLCNGKTFSKWEAECIESLMNSGVAEPVLLIVNGNPPLPPSSLLKRLAGIKPSGHLIWRLFNRFYVNRKSRATAQTDLSSTLEAVKVLTCKTEKKSKFSEIFHDDDMRQIRELKLDFILRFGFGIIKGEILKSAKFGIWSYHHGDPSQYRGQPPGFWELYNRSNLAGAVLQRLSETLDAGTILHAGQFKTERHSYVATRDRLYFGASQWVKRTCIAFAQNEQFLSTFEGSTESGPIYKTPNNIEMMKFLGLTVLEFIKVQFNSLFVHQQWSVAVIDGPIHEVAGLDTEESQSQLLKKAKWASEPKRAFLADPFGANIEASSQGLRIFVEKYDWDQQIGEIGYIGYDDKLGFSDYHPAFKADFHLSYPSIFEDGARQYCIPEASESGSVNILEMQDGLPINFGSGITVPIPAVDPTIVKHNNRYWLFCSFDTPVANTDLHLYYSSKLEGPWSPHPLNPVKTDVRAVRPAGSLFTFEGNLYRPAQDCSVQYGGQIHVNLIAVMDEQNFEETTVAKCSPDSTGRYPYGLHTLSAAGQYTIIDGARKTFIPRYFGATIFQKIRKKLGLSPQ